MGGEGSHKKKIGNIGLCWNDNGLCIQSQRGVVNLSRMIIMKYFCCKNPINYIEDPHEEHEGFSQGEE